MGDRPARPRITEADFGCSADSEDTSIKPACRVPCLETLLFTHCNRGAGTPLWCVDEIITTSVVNRLHAQSGRPMLRRIDEQASH